jgi:hypothetical protein
MGSLSIQSGGHQQLRPPSESDCPADVGRTPEETAVIVDELRLKPMVGLVKAAATLLHDALVKEGDACPPSATLNDLLGNPPARQHELQGKPPGG